MKRSFKAVPIKVGHRYKAKARWRQRALWIGGALVFLATFAVGLTWTNWPQAQEASADKDYEAAQFASQPRFPICCDGTRINCVVDGDTFWFEGERVRVADIDTPEMQGRCPYESQLALRARDRLRALLNEGSFDLRPIGTRNVDQYGRLLRVVVRNGRSLGDTLVSEGLARTWTGRREPWC